MFIEQTLDADGQRSRALRELLLQENGARLHFTEH